MWACLCEFNRAVPPHAIHHPRAETAAHRVRDYLQGPNWRHADIVGNLRAAPSKNVLGVGRRRCPFYDTPSTSKDWCDLWDIVSIRRMERGDSELILPPDIRQGGGRNLRIPWEIVARNTDRSRCRSQRADISPISEEQGFKLRRVMKWRQSSRAEHSAYTPSSGADDSSSKFVYELGVDQPAANAQTPKRSGRRDGRPPSSTCPYGFARRPTCR